MNKVASYKLDVRTVNKSQLLGFYRFGTVGDVRSTSRRVETFGNIGYVFDSDGYLKLKNSVEGDTTYSYARTGELLEVVKPDGMIVSYTNDPMGRRVAKSINGEIVEKYLWLDRTTLLAIFDKDDNLIQRFNYSDSRVPYSMQKDGNVYYLAYDQVGSLRAVSDSSGNIVKEVSYDSFGNIISDSDESFRVPFGFAGGLQDTDTNLIRFGYRDYDPNIGKWTAKDPILFEGGSSNLYGYVLSDPINLIDPEGLADINLVGKNEWWKNFFIDNFLNPSNRITVAGHGVNYPNGDYDSIGDFNNKNIDKLSNQIKQLDKYKQNDNIPIELMSCEVGKTNLPQMIANQTNRDVMAYEGKYYPILGFGIGEKIFHPKSIK